MAWIIFINSESIFDTLHWWEENHHITLNPKMVGCSICCSFKSGLTSFHTIRDDLSILYYFPFLLMMHLDKLPLNDKFYPSTKTMTYMMTLFCSTLHEYYYRHNVLGYLNWTWCYFQLPYIIIFLRGFISCWDIIC